MANQNEEEQNSQTFLSKIKAGTKSFLRFIYNREEKTVIGRNGPSWAKIGAAYAVFYTILFGCLMGLIAIFFAISIRDKTPTYYNEKSVMASRNTLNPGLGFRPQIDNEDSLIVYSNTTSDAQLNEINKSLDAFLQKYYNRNEVDGIDDCDAMKDVQELRDTLLNNGAHCNYDYKEVLRDTTCSTETSYGYLGEGPCVVIKLNRIYGWLPITYDDYEALPDAIKQFDELNNTDILQNNIIVKCNGEYAADQDVLDRVDIAYFSAESKRLNLTSIGLLPIYYYPYLNQNGYESPLVFVQFRNIPKYRLINVVCKAYAQNIDSDDKLHLRGMTLFQLYVK